MKSPGFHVQFFVQITKRCLFQYNLQHLTHTQFLEEFIDNHEDNINIEHYFQS